MAIALGIKHGKQGQHGNEHTNNNVGLMPSMKNRHVPNTFRVIQQVKRVKKPRTALGMMRTTQYCEH